LADRAESNVDTVNDPAPVSNANLHTLQSSFTVLALSNMSKEDKARAAAAQLVIDDEPDDWYVRISILSSGRCGDPGKRETAVEKRTRLTVA
jgi:hypothetical protein